MDKKASQIQDLPSILAITTVKWTKSTKKMHKYNKMKNKNKYLWNSKAQEITMIKRGGLIFKNSSSYRFMSHHTDSKVFTSIKDAFNFSTAAFVF